MKNSKTSAFKTKLSINKVTVSVLDNNQLLALIGGNVFTAKTTKSSGGGGIQSPSQDGNTFVAF